MTNFVDPEVMKGTDDVTSVDYTDPENHVCNDELGIGTQTRMLLCGEVEDDVVRTRVEALFFESARQFYEMAVTKILAKFPFNDLTQRAGISESL